MGRFLAFLSRNKFKVHFLAFVLMMFTPLVMFAAAQGDNPILIWSLLGLVVSANFLSLLVR